MTNNPICTLYKNMFKTFSLGTIVANQRLNGILEKDTLYPGVIIDTNPIPFSGPKINFAIKRIVLHEGFLSYLWCLTYSFFAMYELQKTTENVNITNFDKDSKEVNDSENLLLWAISLQDYHSNWSNELPNPNSKTERTELVNNIFIHVSNFIMYHEAAHVACEHKNYLALYDQINDFLKDNKIPPINLTTAVKQMETEADNYALECLISTHDNDFVRFHKALGAIIATLSNLYVHSGRQLETHTHPDSDTRVFNIIQNANFEDEEYKFKTQAITNLGLNLYLHMHYIDYLPSANMTFDTMTDVISYLFNVIDLEKNKTLISGD